MAVNSTPPNFKIRHILENGEQLKKKKRLQYDYCLSQLKFTVKLNIANIALGVLKTNTNLSVH